MTAIDFGPRDRQGPKRPHASTPPRLRGSVRRTTSLDGRHPHGPAGPSELVLRGRDLRTTVDGTAVELARVEVHIGVDMQAGVLDIGSDPVEARLTRLVGTSPFVGWRRTISDLLPDHREERSLLYLVLDALAGWMGLSAFGLIDAPRPDGTPHQPAPRPGRQFDPASRVDLCAGWQQGGTLLQLMGAGQSGADFVRPPAPALDPPDDPLAWHAMDPLPPYAARRRRRIDVVAGVPLLVDGMFRDSSVDGQGVEGVLHEYTVTAAVDPVTLQVVESDAVPRSLPYQECPQAAVSAEQLVGHDVREMRSFVGREMRGPTTCTHLNELYRTFADIDALASQL
jgi:Protein of unknown function (DUF2889)